MFGNFVIKDERQQKKQSEIGTWQLENCFVYCEGVLLVPVCVTDRLQVKSPVSGILLS